MYFHCCRWSTALPFLLLLSHSLSHLLSPTHSSAEAATDPPVDFHTHRVQQGTHGTVLRAVQVARGNQGTSKTEGIPWAAAQQIWVKLKTDTRNNDLLLLCCCFSSGRQLPGRRLRFDVVGAWPVEASPEYSAVEGRWRARELRGVPLIFQNNNRPHCTL